MKKLLALSVASYMLAGCATSSIAPDYKLASDQKTGLVTGAITYDGSMSGYRVLYRSLDAKGPHGFIETGSGDAVGLLFASRSDAKALGSPGEVFAIGLPAGDYEVYGWQIRSGAATVNSNAPFSIQFRVVAGAILYIGDFHFVQKARMGLTVTGAELAQIDHQDRDLPIVRQKYAAIGNNDVESAIKPGSDNEGLGGSYDTSITIPIIIFHR